MADVAMFPLGSVLFPHMPIALRVFEDRYLVMLARVLGADHPEFGVVLIERGPEAGGGDRRFEIGTMAEITRMTPQDQHVSLLARGGRRVEVVQWLEDDPHPAAIVQEIPDLTWDDDLEGLRAETEHVVRRTLARTAEFAEIAWDSDMELSSDPVQACWQLAAIAPLGAIDQLALLRSRTTRELLSSLMAFTLAAEPLLTTTSSDDEFDAALAELLRDGQDSGGSAGDEPGDMGHDEGDERS